MTTLEPNEKISALLKESESTLAAAFDRVEEICAHNSQKVLSAFLNEQVSYGDFAEVNGYGFFDDARDKIERVFARVLGAEDALVRPQILSGTNAIYLTLSGLLHPGDTMVAISGTPYDPLQEIVGIRGESPLALTRNGISYEEIDLVDSEFDYAAIEKRIKAGGVRLVEIQRSCGYSHRKGLSVEQIAEVATLIKRIDPSVILFCDNCYGELAETKEPTEVGVDVIAGSLMHNLGGGIASSGGYIAGRRDLIEQIADRLTSPGMGKYLGANYNQNIKFLKGLFFAPRTVANAVKSAILASFLAEKLGYTGVCPRYADTRSDIVQTFNLPSAEALIQFCQTLQSVSPVDSQYASIPCEMPGYPHEEIMAAGTFSQGSTIELTADGPVVPPYTVYLQGGLTYEYAKLAFGAAFSKLTDDNN